MSFAFVVTYCKGILYQVCTLPVVSFNDLRTLWCNGNIPTDIWLLRVNLSSFLDHCNKLFPEWDLEALQLLIGIWMQLVYVALIIDTVCAEYTCFDIDTYS